MPAAVGFWQLCVRMFAFPVVSDVAATLFVIVIRLLPIPVFENIGWIPLIAAMLLPCIRMDVSGTLCQKQGFVAHVIVQVTPLQTIPGVFPAVASPL